MKLSIITSLLLSSLSFAGITPVEKKEIEISFAKVQEDLCWTSNVEGCEVDGDSIKVVYPFKNFYLKGGVTHYESENGTYKGDPNLSETLFEFGIGKEFSFNDTLTAIAEASILVADDYEAYNGLDNQNYNDGFEIKALLEKRFTDYFKMGGGVTYQNFQNCSTEACHGLKDQKPVMKNIEGEVYGTFKINEQVDITYRIFRVTEILNDEYYNGRSRGYNHMLELKYKFKKR